MDLKNQLIPGICIGCMHMGVLFSHLYPKGDKRRHKATIIFVGSAALLLSNWLMAEPDVLLIFLENFGWVLFGLVNTFVRILK